MMDVNHPALKRGTEQYNRVKEFVRVRVDFAKREMGGRRAAWRENEKQYRAFLDLEAVDKQRKRRDGEKGTYPGFAPLIIPVPYAVTNTIITYLMSVFGARRPVIMLDGWGPEDVKPAEALETVLAYQMEQRMLLMKMYLWLHDMLVYGIGWMKTTWRRQFQYQTVLETGQAMQLLSKLFQFDPPKKRVTRWVKSYEGNDPQVIDPYRCWHDPRVPVSKLNDGEFIFFSARKSFLNLKTDEANGLYVNIDMLKDQKASAGSSGKGDGESNQSDIARQMGFSNLTEEEYIDKTDTGYPLLEEMWARVIPRELGLSSSSYPEIWVFTVANKEVVIRVEQAEENHGMYPVDGIEYMPDIHSPGNPGVVELISPLSQHLTWLFNSHMENVRKAINDVMVYDPTMVVAADLEARGPGKLIRLKPQAYGKDVRSAISQLVVQDITGGHLKDAQVVWDLIQRISAATDNFMGLPTVGGARTATEVRGINQLAGGRLKNLAEIVSMMGFTPFSKKCVQNTQQFLEDEKFYRLVGRAVQNPEVLQQIKVGPEEIIGNFDFIPIDGTYPMDKFAMAEVWKEIFSSVVQVEPLLQVFDVVEIFRKSVQELGVKNIDDFRLKPDSLQAQIMQQRAIEDKVKKGDAVPLGGPESPEAGMTLAKMLAMPNAITGGRSNGIS